MYCPQCHAKYAEGIVACPDCREVLVEDLCDDDRTPEYIEYIPLLATYNAGDIALIRSILDAEGIRYHLLGEFFNIVRPLVDPVRLLVDREDLAAAWALLSRLDLSISGISTLKTPDDIPD
jgi:hypothetical protein